MTGPVLALLAFAGAMVWLSTIAPGAANAAIGALLLAGFLAILEAVDWVRDR
jgi:hypothetical protein